MTAWTSWTPERRSSIIPPRLLRRRRMLMSFRNLRFPSKKEEGEGRSW